MEDPVGRRMHGPRDYLDAARADGTDAALLAELARQPYGFVREAVAEHPATPASTLLEMIPDSLETWGDQALLLKIVAHRAADAAVIERARARVGEALAAGRRPYGLALDLAARGALSAIDADALGRLPGASARFRRGLARAVAHAVEDPAVEDPAAGTPGTTT